MIKFINFKFLSHILIRFLCPWRSGLRYKRTLCFLCLTFVFLIILGLFIFIRNITKCSFVEVEKAVYTICDKYQNREALGNLCADLCELNYLKPNSCLPHHFGKDVVFEATYFDEHVVIKSSKLYSSQFDQLSYEDKDGHEVNPDIQTFLSMIINTIETNLDIKIKPTNNQSLELLSKIWTRSMKNFNELPFSIQHAAMNNIWFLAQQTEYLLMKYYEDTNIFPKILGTCGPFYAVEFIQPLSNYFLTLYPSWKKDFSERAKLAIKILIFLEEIERKFPSLHFCDVKVGHFGLDKNNNIKLLDMDMVYFEASLIKNMIAASNCSKDEDCFFFDCKGLCDTTQQKCQAEVTDTNFQRVCTNIFSGKLMQSYFGLLSSPPPSIAKELYSLLQKCSKKIDNKAVHILASQIKHILVQEVNN